MQIRRASESDLATVAALFDAYRQFYQRPSDLPLARDFIAARLRQGDSTILIALDDKAALGFVQLYPTPYGDWDSHQKLKENHAKQCGQIDKPVAGLVKDLKRRGLFDDVLVVFCTEFGRTPGLEQRAGGKDGRDHHPHGFTVWLAGAGIKGGTVHGTTDELGFHAAEHPHYVTDIHATVLHLLGLDPRRLDVPGRKRLEIDYGKVIREGLA